MVHLLRFDILTLLSHDHFWCRTRGHPCCAARLPTFQHTYILGSFIHLTLVGPGTLCMSFLRSDSGCCQVELVSEHDMEPVVDLGARKCSSPYTHDSPVIPYICHINDSCVVIGQQSKYSPAQTNLHKQRSGQRMSCSQPLAIHPTHGSCFCFKL